MKKLVSVELRASRTEELRVGGPQIMLTRNNHGPVRIDGLGEVIYIDPRDLAEAAEALK